jgi:hypothetical protein
VLDRLARAPRHDPHHPDVRLVVQARARGTCEYCLMPATAQFHVEHIVPPRLWSASLRGTPAITPEPAGSGPDHLDNFAWSCSFCNYAKGQRISARVGRQTVRLFHPRRDRWQSHFLFAEQFLLILGGSDIGQATVTTLSFNDARPNGPLAARHRAIVTGGYPPPWAKEWSIGNE